MKRKNIIIISSISIIILIIAVISIFLVNTYSKNNTEKEKRLTSGNSKLIEIYNKMQKEGKYKITKILDDSNQVTTMVADNKAYKEQKANSKVSKYFCENSTLYLLLNYNKTYYSYQNNDTIVYENTLAFKNLIDMQYTEGKEKINRTTYEYEEYLGTQDFLLNTEIALLDDKDAITKLYFKDNELKYIKTICGDKEELLKIEISYNIDEDKLQIPEGYTSNR